MITRNFVKKNYYSDSVTLMVISSKLTEIAGVSNASVMMGTDYNKCLMTNAGLLLSENMDITPNDMVIGVIAENEEVIEEVFKAVDEMLENKKKGTGKRELRTKTQDSAVSRLGGANFAVISVPGRYAKDETMKALDNGLNVLLFSDNVSIQEEIELKEKAVDKGLLMMGPDCGTAIINGTALGFANILERGNIGMVAASGTGLQEVSVIVDKLGSGVSQAIGTGGRDLKEAVGGKMMLMGIDALAEDPETKVIVLISKPPAPGVMEKILDRVKKIDKKVVTCFLGGDPQIVKESGAYAAQTLEDAATAAVKFSRGEDAELAFFTADSKEIAKIVGEETKKLSENQKYVRGLYSGGTLCLEGLLIMNEFIGDIYSNIALNKELSLENVEESKENTFVDMGEDYFTNGRPHPMIDPRLRVDRIKKEAMDKETGVILLDCVIGYGSHEDPAGALVKAINEAREIAEKDGRYISFIGSICGTEKDPQVRSEQEKKLRDAGVIIMPSNAQAARLASLIVSRGKDMDKILRGE